MTQCPSEQYGASCLLCSYRAGGPKHPSCFPLRTVSTTLVPRGSVVIPVSLPLWADPRESVLTLLCISSSQAGRQAGRTGLGTAVYICLSLSLVGLHLYVAIPGSAHRAFQSSLRWVVGPDEVSWRRGQLT